MSWLDRILDGWGLQGGAPAAPRGDPQRIAEVQRHLEEIRPYLRADGGDVRLVAVEDDAVVVTLAGACHTCTASHATIQGLLEPRLRERCPWISAVRVEP